MSVKKGRGDFPAFFQKSKWNQKTGRFSFMTAIAIYAVAGLPDGALRPRIGSIPFHRRKRLTCFLKFPRNNFNPPCNWFNRTDLFMRGQRPCSSHWHLIPDIAGHSGYTAMFMGWLWLRNSPIDSLPGTGGASAASCAGFGDYSTADPS